MALGSTPGQLKSMVIRNGLKKYPDWVGGGDDRRSRTRVGTMGAAFWRSIARSTDDGSVAALLLTVAMVAHYLPARRATRMDPRGAPHQE
jgi:hypothetical protein